MKNAPALVAGLCALTGVSCACQPPTVVCTAASECPAGYTCRQEQCVRQTDAGSHDSAVADGAAADRSAADVERTDQTTVSDAVVDASHLDAPGDTAPADRSTGDGATGDRTADGSAVPDAVSHDRTALDITTATDSAAPVDAAPGADAADAATCVGNCTGRCGGADDGCGGQCQADCATGYICQDRVCIDDDECTTHNPCDPCSTHCVNLVGSYRCDCRAGFANSYVAQCEYQDDGDLVASGEFDLTTQQVVPDRTCSDGALFSVTAIGGDTVTVAGAIPACCLVPGVRVLLIELQGVDADSVNVGHFETGAVASATANQVRLPFSIPSRFGTNGSAFAGIGTSALAHRVALYRVPTYRSVQIATGGRLVAAAWNGMRGGVLALRSLDTFSVEGAVDMSGAGYRGGDYYCGMNLSAGHAFQGESIARLGELSAASNIGGGGGGCYAPDCVSSGAGGGHGEVGDNALLSCDASGCASEVAGGAAHGANTTAGIAFLGSGGGGAGQYSYGASCLVHPVGGNGGGIIMIDAVTLSVLAAGSIRADGRAGSGGTQVGGGGAGGSILLNTTSGDLGTGQVTAVGGGLRSAGNPQGGVGKIRCVGSCTGTTNP